MRILPFRVLLAGVALALFAAIAHACSVPVFRYALERWRHDKAEDLYRVVIFHNGPLSEEEKKIVAALEKPNDGLKLLANWTVDTVDVAGKAQSGRALVVAQTVPSFAIPSLPSVMIQLFGLTRFQEASLPVPQPFAEAWESQKNETLPRAVLFYPDARDEVKPIWSGPLGREQEKLNRYLDSPARRLISKRILQGHSVVWVMLECGDPEKDIVAFHKLGEELKGLQDAIELPPQDDDPASKLQGKLPLKILFSTLRLSRHEAAEREFVELLLGIDPELAKSKEPIVFPIFGRGRVLAGLAGEEASGRVLQSAATFLCGACSCKVKLLNPGHDLPFIADWDSILEDRAVIVPEPPSGAGEKVELPPGLPANPPLTQDLPCGLGITCDEQGNPLPREWSLLKKVLLGGAVVSGMSLAVAGLVLLRRRGTKVELPSTEGPLSARSTPPVADGLLPGPAAPDDRIRPAQDSITEKP
jgi:hypothetical protein